MAKQDQITRVEREVSVILNDRTYEVPSYRSLEEYSRALLGQGLLLSESIMSDTDEPAVVRLKAVGAITSISRHISERMDAMIKKEDDLEDDLDEE